jgi:hypothetical protein
MIYFIGGPARCGKSTLAARVRKEIDGQVIAGDAFVHALYDNLLPEWLPDLFDRKVDSVTAIHDPEAKVDRLRRRDAVMWQFYQAYIATATADAPGDDVLLEGNLWPDSLDTFAPVHRAAFLIDTSASQVERLIAIRDANGDNDWMREFSDQKLAEWAEFNIIRSRRYVALCDQYGYRYFDIAESGIADAEQRAFEYLTQNAVQ